MKVQVKKITAVLTAVIMAAVMLCCFGSRALPNRLKITFAAEDPAAEYGAVGVVRVTVQAENPVDVDWSIAWTDESETLPIENYFKIRPISYDTSMTVDVICRSYTESEAELSAWIHGAPHTKITKKLTAPLVREEVADGIDSIDMPAVTGSLHPLFPSCETALAIVKLTNDMILSANTSGSAKDGFLRLVSQTGRRYYDFELADPEALDGAVTLEDVVSTLYVVLDPTYHGYFRALQWLPIEGLKRYRDGKSEIISGIQLFQEKTALRISFTGELTAEEERNFFAAMEIPVLCDDYFYTWDGKKDKRRFRRKGYMNRWNYFVTFTYDDEKQSEESFRKRLRVCLSHLHTRRGWRYMGVFERAPETGRLHFHGIFYVPEGEMLGTITEKKDYSTARGRMQKRHENDFFVGRFGRNDFEELNEMELRRGQTINYVLKYIAKSGERVMYSRGICSEICCALEDEDIITEMQHYGVKYVLWDGVIVWERDVMHYKRRQMSIVDLTRYPRLIA